MLQRRPTRRMLHDVNILVPFSIYFIFDIDAGDGDRLGPKSSNISKKQKIFVSISFPPEGNFDIDAGVGDGGTLFYKTKDILYI